MYEFHYDVMKPIYKEKIRLCYQDTDSLIYEIETDDIYEDMSGNGETGAMRFNTFTTVCMTGHARGDCRFGSRA